MIIKDEIAEEKNRIQKIFKMLEDVKLPKNYKFVDDCVEIRYFSFFGFFDSWIANIKLKGDILVVRFRDEEELNILRNCFVSSKTKFELEVKAYY